MKASLITCQVCAHQVANTARACPSCGHPVPKPRRSAMESFTIFAVLVFAGLLTFAYLKSKGDDQKRRLERESAQDLQDIAAGRYHPPLKVRITP